MAIVHSWLRRFRNWLSGQERRSLPDPLRLAAQAARPPAHRTVTSASSSHVQERAARVAGRSRTLAIRLFGANQPVENPRDLFGRQRELDSLRTAVLETGMHAVIYGPRGSGKTSLVRVFGDMADAGGATVIYLSCAGGGDFGDVMLPYLDEIGPAAFGMRADTFDNAVGLVRASPTPRSFAALLARADREDVVLILDEFDRLDDRDAKGQLALLMKLLSDMRSRVRLIFVGISGDVGELIDVHASVRRHILPVGLTPIADTEVESFISTTSQAIGLVFDQEALSLLRWLVCGSPYHMRLFSLHGCLCAIERDQRFANAETVLSGVDRARASWRETNQRDDALFNLLVSERRFPPTAIETFAHAAATRLEFTIEDLTDALCQAGLEPALASQLVQAFAPALGKLPQTEGSEEKSLRLAFDDVLAPQFLLSICARHRWDHKNGQRLAGKGNDR